MCLVTWHSTYAYWGTSKKFWAFLENGRFEQPPNTTNLAIGSFLKIQMVYGLQFRITANATPSFSNIISLGGPDYGLWCVSIVEIIVFPMPIFWLLSLMYLSFTFWSTWHQWSLFLLLAGGHRWLVEFPQNIYLKMLCSLIPAAWWNICLGFCLERDKVVHYFTSEDLLGYL
jgi:hypothetical protein